MASKNIVNNSTIDYDLLKNACSRKNMNRLTALKILNQYYGKKTKILGVNDPFPNSSNWSPLAYSVFFGKTEETDFLLRAGANPNTLINDNISVLHLAANDGKSSICSLLLNAGADINIQSNKGLTPLAVSCQSGEKDTISLLLKYGPDISITDSSGKTCLDHALEFKHFDIISLIEHSMLSKSVLEKDSSNKKVNKI